MHKKRIAIVGSGCSGIGALWALKDAGHDVQLYEASNRIGGHTNTVRYNHNGSETNVDTGFIVFNSATYRQSPFLDAVIFIRAYRNCNSKLYQILESYWRRNRPH